MCVHRGYVAFMSTNAPHCYDDHSIVIHKLDLSSRLVSIGSRHAFQYEIAIGSRWRENVGAKELIDKVEVRR